MESKPLPRRGRPSARHIRMDRAGLHERAVSRLRTLIVRGELVPGEPLNEAGLSEALGVSRTPLREALKLLAAEGLVQLRLNRSGVVAPLKAEELVDLFEAVSGIERIAAELAAARMTKQDLEKLEKLQERMERHHRSKRLKDYFEINQQVHSAIVAAARNEAIKATHNSLLARAERARFLALSFQGRVEESLEEHRQVLAALAARDGEKAGRMLAAHVLRTGHVVVGLLTQNGGLPGSGKTKD